MQNLSGVQSQRAATPSAAIASTKSSLLAGAAHLAPSAGVCEVFVHDNGFIISFIISFFMH